MPRCLPPIHDPFLCKLLNISFASHRLAADPDWSGTDDIGFGLWLREAGVLVTDSPKWTSQVLCLT